MNAFLINIAVKFFKIQPATAGTKTFFAGIGGIAVTITAICTAVANNDTNVMDYVQALVPALIGLGTIFHRDGLTKFADKISSLTKLLIITAILFCCVQPARAADKVDEPFKYFLKSINISEDTTYYGLTPTVVIPDMILSNADSGKTGLDVEAFNALGVGVDYGRYIKSADGKTYETFGVSLFTLLATNQDVMLGGAFHVFNRTLGIGGGADLGNVRPSKRWKIFMTTGLRIF
jgi:hypothetical protein